MAGWAPQAEWAFGFGADARDKPFLQELLQVNFSVASPALQRASFVEVSLNGQQFSARKENVRYHGLAGVVGASPLSGPVSGDTLVVISGMHLSTVLSNYSRTQFMCRFGRVGEVPATSGGNGVLICSAPPAPEIGDHALQISMNNLSFSGSGIIYRYHHENTVSALYPPSGSAAGGSLCFMQGLGLEGGDDIVCSFGGSLSNASYDLMRDQVRCLAPQAAALGSAPVRLSLNGQQFSMPPLTYYYHASIVLQGLLPSSGPALGGTNVSVSGKYFLQRPPGATCKTGARALASAYRFPAKAGCMAPPASTARAAERFLEDFSLSPESEPRSFQVEWTGAARLIEGALHMTAVLEPVIGSVTATPRWSGLVNTFYTSFSVQMGPHTRFWFLCLGNVGPIDCATAPGGGAPLEVQFSFERAQLRVLTRADELAREQLDMEHFVWGSWKQLEVKVFEYGLSVTHNGFLLLDKLPLVSCLHQEWSFEFVVVGGSDGKADLRNAIDGLHVRSGSALEERVVELGIGNNAQQFSDKRLNFSYYAEPVVSRLHVERGPVAGGSNVTVTGSSFRGGSEYRCRFGGPGMVVHGTCLADRDALHCMAPPQGPANVSVEVSLNAQQFTTSGVMFEYYALVRVSHVVPIAGPPGGGTQLTVHGEGFSRGLAGWYRCQYGGGAGAVLEASLVSDSVLRCETPASGCGVECAQAVEVSLNSESYSMDGVLYTYHTASVQSLSVASGPVLGGTVLTVRGEGFLDAARVHTLCRFGRASVVADYLGSTELRCKSPVADGTGSGSLVQLDFASPDSGVQLFGLPRDAVHIAGGMLQLTRADFERSGSALFAVPDIGSMAEFVAEFGVYVGGGTVGGEGMSFNMGASMPRTYFDERGAGDGLSVLFLTSEGLVEVWFAGAVVARGGDGSLTLSVAAFVPVRIAYTDEGLSVSYNGEALLEGVVLEGWSPAPTWVVSFGARTGLTKMDCHALDNVRIVMGSRFRAQDAALEVSLNSQENTLSEVGFSYYAEPVVSRLHVERGPVAGGSNVTVTGSSFRGGSEYRCRFGGPGMVVHGTYLADRDALHCMAPPQGPANVSVEVSLNAQQFTTSGVMFEYYALVRVSHVVPIAGPPGGGTQLTVHGEGFSRGLAGWYRCQYGGGAGAVLEASLVSDSVLRCETPASGCGVECAQAVEVSLNSESYSMDGVLYTYHTASVQSLSVASGPVLGGTVLTVRGEGFLDAARVHTLCRFGRASVVADYLGSTELRCKSPVADGTGSGSLVQLDFASPDSGVQLFGLPRDAVHIAGGMLQLTRADFERSGSALFAVPDIGSMAEFVAEFGVYVGGGTVGGEGMSFNMGASMPRTYFDERGAGDGLSVLFLTSEGLVEVWFAGAVVARGGDGSLTLSVAAFVPVRIAYTDEGLSVSYNGEALLEGVVLEGWSPAPTWVVSFGARTGLTKMDCHALDNVRIVMGSRFRAQDAALEVSLNSQENTLSEVGFSYYAEPVVSRLHVERGPVAGGSNVTVTGSSFRGGSEYRCRFGGPGMVVHGTYLADRDALHCMAPPQGPANVSVEVSLNAQQFTTSGVMFEYYALVRVSHVVPIAGPPGGGTQLTVHGEGFSRGLAGWYRCQYGGGAGAVLEASLVSDSVLRCETPASGCGVECAQAVEVSLNSESYSMDGVLYTYHTASVQSLSVASGPVLGGTVLTVRGEGFLDAARVHTLCRFGRASVVADYLGSTELRCKSPVADGTGSGSLVQLDFASPDSGVQLFGLPRDAVHIAGGMLQLTRADFERSGSALFAVPDIGSMAEFVAEFGVYVGGGAVGGEGMSFNMGASMPRTYFDERGAGDGLSVLFLTSEGLVEVWFAGAVVARGGDGSLTLSVAAFVPVRIAYTDEGLSVSYNGEALLEGVVLEGWSPAPTWVVSFGARTGLTKMDCHALDNVRIVMGSRFRAQDAALEVSLNSQENTLSEVGFSYYAEPVVSRLHVERGPVAGGSNVTVTGSSFRGGSEYRCRFGGPGMVVHGTYLADRDALHCMAPPQGPANVSVEVSLNAQQFTTSGVMFEYYALVRVSHVVPIAGPPGGGTQLTVHGEGFSRGLAGWYRCQYGGGAGAVLEASLVSDSVLRCETPASGCGVECAQAVEVSLNSESYSMDGVLYTYHTASVQSLSVASGPVLGGTVLTVRGEGFLDAARVHTLCRFGRASVVADYLGSTELRCMSPPVDEARVSSSLSFDYSDSTGLTVSGPTVPPAKTAIDGVLHLFTGLKDKPSVLISAPFALVGHVRAMEATFDFWIGGGRSTAGWNAIGECVSFCLGDLSFAPIIDHGIVDELCISFLANTNAIFITLNAELVASAQCELGHLSAETWLRASVRLLDTRLSLVHSAASVDCAAVLSETVLPRMWSLRDESRFGFGAPTGVPHAAEHWVDGLRVTAGALLAATPAAVKVSLNAQQYTLHGSAYTYQGEPHLRDVFPTGGPTDGGTLLNLVALVPANFDGASSLRCIFDTARVDASWDGAQQTLSCRSPAMVMPGMILLRASMVKDGRTLDNADGVQYVFYAPPVVELIEPNAGPIDGGTRLVLYGEGFIYGIGPYWCRLAGEHTPASISAALGVLWCATPPSNNSSLSCPVAVSLNGQQYTTSGAAYNFYSPPRIWSISPASGTMLGSVLVTVTGTSFVSSFRTWCRWAGDTTNGTWRSPTVVVCPSPPHGFGLVALEISQNGQQYSGHRVLFSYYQSPRVTMLSVPSVQSALGSWQSKATHLSGRYIMVRVWGSGFGGGTDYRCQIGPNEPVAAEHDETHDCIQCWSDLWINGDNRVEVTLNGRQYTSNNLNVSIDLYWAGYLGGTYDA